MNTIIVVVALTLRAGPRFVLHEDVRPTFAPDSNLSEIGVAVLLHDATKGGVGGQFAPGPTQSNPCLNKDRTAVFSLQAAGQARAFSRPPPIFTPLWRERAP